MCDEHYESDVEKTRVRLGLSRREFAAVTAATAISFLLPHAAEAAVDVKEEEVNIKTPDGTADGYFVHPATGTGAGVIVWPDILGLRPAFRTMGKRLAQEGYSVLVVNPFYRSKKAPVIPDGTKFTDGMPIARPMAALLNPTTHVSDAKAFAAWLDTQPSVSKTRKIGTTGYCMGGPIVMRTAAAVPARIGAGATFHGGTNYHDQVRGAVAEGYVVFAPLTVMYPFRDRDHNTPIPADVRGILDDQLRERGTTLMLTTHDLQDIEALCDRVIVIDHGTAVFDGPLTGLQGHAGASRTLTPLIITGDPSGCGSNLPAHSAP